ncbi:MAG: hypothetical protein F4026_08270, partial [Synechococcus sp. SB0669_bin_8]|nr:hypothetical protein [Synechococcus sp. SB0669_bin_8]
PPPPAPPPPRPGPPRPPPPPPGPPPPRPRPAWGCPSLCCGTFGCKGQPWETCHGTGAWPCCWVPPWPWPVAPCSVALQPANPMCSA